MQHEWLRNFVTIVEQRSFVHAAQLLNITPSVLTKQLIKLEKELGKRLILRTSQQFKLTQAGALYYNYARKILNLQLEAKKAIKQGECVLRGQIRIAMATPFIRLSRLQKIYLFLEKNPAIHLIFIKGNAINIILQNEADIVFTTKKSELKSIQYDKLLDLHKGVFANPNYLKKNPTKSIEDLSERNCLVNLSATPDYVWYLHGKHVVVDGNLSAVSTESLITSACKGLGLIYTYAEFIEVEIKNKLLIPVFSFHPNDIVPLYIAYRVNIKSDALDKFIQFISSEQCYKK